MPKSKPKVRYYWCTSTDGYPCLQIKIPIPDKETLEKIFNVERLLKEIGIRFDTGCGGCRDWEFDWSLSGNHYAFNSIKGKWARIRRKSK